MAVNARKPDLMHSGCGAPIPAVEKKKMLNNLNDPEQNLNKPEIIQLWQAHHSQYSDIKERAELCRIPLFVLHVPDGHGAWHFLG